MAAFIIIIFLLIINGVELKNKKSAIRVARLTIHDVDVRNPPGFTDKLVEDGRLHTSYAETKEPVLLLEVENSFDGDVPIRKGSLPLGTTKSGSK